MKKILILIASLLAFNAFAVPTEETQVKNSRDFDSYSENDTAFDSDLKHRHARTKTNYEEADLINIHEKNPHEETKQSRDFDIVECEEGDGPKDTDIKKHSRNKNHKK